MGPLCGDEWKASETNHVGKVAIRSAADEAQTLGRMLGSGIAVAEWFSQTWADTGAASGGVRVARCEASHCHPAWRSIRGPRRGGEGLGLQQP